LAYGARNKTHYTQRLAEDSTGKQRHGGTVVKLAIDGSRAAWLRADVVIQ
jgi:hypothetical protein